MSKASIDRFEGDRAILVDENGREQVVSRAALPADAREGDVINLETFAIDREETERRRAEVAAARARLARERLPDGGEL